ncbi:MutS family DNA mismatch repair protein [Rhabdobacter roseus]|uniref:ABC-type multidrug transport system fused ATPase/permease subunit n=1 Tax=Rhabdobacter roseus TaxID=1655419 RepID=A0A840TUJ9_9BACT|nr:DNA mismatch repair protein MutS [Rhabdobacter roseus]MBB5283660.1 ABC-type multidrug transport system fused ATPase/permease subunit [Rhabdobacter roseus]
MTIYKNNLQEYEATLSKLAQASNRLSTLRLLAFIISATAIIIVANARVLPLLLLVVPLCFVGFALLIKRYNQVTSLKQHTTFLKEINEQELVRLENKLSGFPTGQTFSSRSHAYVSDLDIFGAHSLFQLINRATTESGQALLASWLAEPAPKSVILERQKAVQELTPKLGWRQDFQASGLPFKNAKSDYDKLLAWIEKPVLLLPHQTRYLAVSILLAVVSTAAALYFLRHVFTSDWLVSSLPLVLLLFINSRVLKKVSTIAEEIIESTQHNVKTVGGYQALIARIEGESFDSEVLQRLQSTFSQQHYSAVSEIKKLKNILEVFQLRGTKKEIGRNTMYSIFNTLWLLDIHWILQTEKWKYKNGDHLRTWASSVSEFEVLSSLAGFAYSNPSFTFPEIKEEPYSIHFESLGHPLISAEKRACNDFSLENRGEIMMITGSNMAGKSTFLRTVGVNLVLALMGAPCCAKAGRVSHMKIFTSMRTQDNLEEGISSFYAELKRIEQLLKLIESGEAIFFLLDEMFKGTNSQDRYKGGVSLIKQLSELNAFGMISTHDLELAKLAENHQTVENFSFNSEIREGEIIFNYALTEGICTDFNASELMKRSGIKILSTLDEQ